MKNRHHNSYGNRHSRYYGNDARNHSNGVLYFSGEVEPGDGSRLTLRLTRGQVAILNPSFGIEYGVGDRVTAVVDERSLYNGGTVVFAKVVRRERPKKIDSSICGHC